MDDILLIEAVERYVSGAMSAAEKDRFEALRQKDPEMDQFVVEHIYFLQGMEKFGETKAFRHSLQEVESQLIGDGFMNTSSLSGKAKVVHLWQKYRRSIAVAASIAGFVSVLSTAIMVTYTKKIGNDNIEYLVSRINQTDREVKILKGSVTNTTNTQVPLPTAPKVDFRATGFLIDGKGFIITNSHVISRMKNIYVENKKGNYFKAEAVYTDNLVDLAILQITDTSFKPVTSLPYNIKRGNADLGEQFFTLGFPRNEIVYGEGYLSAKSGNDGDSSAYQLTVSANPGNSGGPVINRNGEIIGIITAKDNKADGVVYAAKSKNIFNLVDKLKEMDSIKFGGLKTPVNTDLKGLDRIQQVKKMEEFVYMVVGN